MQTLYKTACYLLMNCFQNCGYIYRPVLISFTCRREKTKKTNNFTGLHAVLCKLVACRTTFSGNSLSNPFVWLYRSVTSLWRNLGPLFFTAVLQFIKDCRQLFMHGTFRFPWQDFTMVEVWNLGRCNTLILSFWFLFFSHSVAGLLLCLGSLSQQFWIKHVKSTLWI